MLSDLLLHAAQEESTMESTRASLRSPVTPSDPLPRTVPPNSPLGAPLPLTRGLLSSLPPESLLSPQLSQEELLLPLPPALLPPPLHASNAVGEERATRACYAWGLDTSLHPDQWHYRLLGPPPTLRSEGWRETLERRVSRSGMERTNPGLLSNTTGATTEFVLNTAPLHPPTINALINAPIKAPADDRTTGIAHGSVRGKAGSVAAPSVPWLLVQLHYLQSYERMGRVRVSCSGCRCGSHVIDAHAPGGDSAGWQNISGRGRFCFHVSAAERCRLSLTVLPQTSSGEHRFVLHELQLLEVKRSGSASRASSGNGDRADCDHPWL